MFWESTCQREKITDLDDSKLPWRSHSLYFSFPSVPPRQKIDFGYPLNKFGYQTFSVFSAVNDWFVFSFLHAQNKAIITTLWRPGFRLAGQTIQRCWCNTLFISELLSKNKEIVGEINSAAKTVLCSLTPALFSAFGEGGGNLREYLLAKS